MGVKDKFSNGDVLNLPVSGFLLLPGLGRVMWAQMGPAGGMSEFTGKGGSRTCMASGTQIRQRRRIERPPGRGRRHVDATRTEPQGGSSRQSQQHALADNCCGYLWSEAESTGGFMYGGQGTTVKETSCAAERWVFPRFQKVLLCRSTGQGAVGC